jgi:transforming growth factor-beta-induced protein
MVAMIDTLSKVDRWPHEHVTGSGRQNQNSETEKIIPMRTLKVLPLGLALVGLAFATSSHANPAGKEKDLVAVAVEAGSFKTLVAAVKAAGLVETLQGAGPFTIFAPTDAAFAKLPPGTVEDLLKPQNKAKLAGILTYHVVPGKVMAADVTTMKATTVNGQQLSIAVADGKVRVDDALVVKTDIPARNGVIHVIDSVILPQ